MTLALESPGGDAAGAKAQRFFDRGRDVADAGNFNYAIEMFLHGLSLGPDDVAAHRELRLIALERKARGGSDIGSFDKVKLRETLAKCTDPRQAMLIAEKLFAYDPASVACMKAVADHATRAGCALTAKWFEQLIADAQV